MDLKRKDTPENIAFWESVEGAAEDWRRIKPAWAKTQENKADDLFIILFYLVTNRGIRSIDMTRKRIGLSFLFGFLRYLDGSIHNIEAYLSPYADEEQPNKMLIQALRSGDGEKNPLFLTLFLLLRLRIREYVGPPESESWYESDLEERLRFVNRTMTSAFAISVSDARTAEELLLKMPQTEKEVLEKISTFTVKYLKLS